MGQTVNLLAFAFGGPNPSVPTRLKILKNIIKDYDMNSRRFRATVWLSIPIDVNSHYTEDKLEDEINETLYTKFNCDNIDCEVSKEPLDEVSEDITKFDEPSGFIAPDGKFYGMNSDELTLAHMALAEEVYEFYKDKFDIKNRTGYGIDFDLERNGFIKIRDNKVIYWVTDDENPIYWTKEQCDTVLNYIRHMESLSNCVVFSNGAHNFDVTSSQFSQMDKFSILKKFGL